MNRLALHVWISTVLLFGSSIAAEVEVLKDVAYLEAADYPDNKDKLDLYIPEEDGPHPVMIFLHGGGLLHGSKDPYGFIGRYFAENGFVTVIPNYRLSPGIMHPAHIEDAAASFAWVHENIATHGGNADRIFVTGHSAGAYLVGLLALDGRYLKAHGLSPDNIAGAVPISGFFHVERLAPERPKTVWGEDPEAWLEASPARYPNADAPPLLFLYADGDVPERRKESEDMAAALRAKGHRHATTQQIDGRDHVSIARKLASDGDETAPAILDFMNGILKQDDATD